MIAEYGTYTVKFAEYTNHDYGLFATRPNIPSMGWNYKETEIPGKDGKLVTFDGTAPDIPIEITFGFYGEANSWGARFRAAKIWLLEHKSGALILGDDPDVFYRVKRITIDTAERKVWEIGQFKATFVCEGYQYLTGGREFMPMDAVKFNPYLECKPVYKIEGGDGTAVLTVNGVEMTVIMQTDCVIDTDKLIAHTVSGQRKNTDVTGDFEKMHMVHGKNEISISAGYTLTIKPNWRCF